MGLAETLSSGNVPDGFTLADSAGEEHAHLRGERGVEIYVTPDYICVVKPSSEGYRVEAYQLGRGGRDPGVLAVSLCDGAFIADWTNPGV